MISSRTARESRSFVDAAAGTLGRASRHPTALLAVILLVSLTLIDREVAQGLGPINALRVSLDLAVGASACAALSGIRPLRMMTAAYAISLGASVTFVVKGDEPPLLGAAELASLLLLGVIGIRCGTSPKALAAVNVMLIVGVVSVGLLRRTPGFGIGTDTAYLAACAVGTAGLGWWWRAAQSRRAHALQALREAERLAVARDLHDEVAHHIAGIVVQLQALRVVTPENPDRVVSALPMLEAAASRSLEAMRQMVWTLRAPSSSSETEEHGDLIDEVHKLAGGSGIPVDLVIEVDSTRTVPGPVSVALQRVLREALANVARHAQLGTTAHVRIEINDYTAAVDVTNDGASSTAFSAGVGVGLKGLDERVSILHGKLVAGALPRGGWRLAASIPLLERP